MSAWWSEELRPLGEHLAPYARDSLERAAHLAARLHAEEVSPEHLLVALLEDESGSATRVLLHAFADPATIGAEVLALCTGIMVVGSGHTLPFSVRGLEALRAARRDSARRQAAQVEPEDIFSAAEALFPEELRARLAETGPLSSPGPDAGASGAAPAEAGEGLFRRYSPPALRALAAACKAAASLERTAIGPAHLSLGCLEVDSALRERTGLTAPRLRMRLQGADEDGTPIPQRKLPCDPRLRELLAALPARSRTLDMLDWILSNGSEELKALLRRQKVTPQLLERCRGIYEDPPTPRD